jgi:hypothetical protein
LLLVGVAVVALEAVKEAAGTVMAEATEVAR